MVDRLLASLRRFLVVMVGRYPFHRKAEACIKVDLKLNIEMCQDKLSHLFEGIELAPCMVAFVSSFDVVKCGTECLVRKRIGNELLSKPVLAMFFPVESTL